VENTSRQIVVESHWWNKICIERLPQKKANICVKHWHTIVANSHVDAYGKHSSPVHTHDVIKEHWNTNSWISCRNLSLWLTTKARACKGACQEGRPRVTSYAPRSVGECEGMNPHTPKWAPILGVGVPNLQRVIARVKTHWIEKLLISLKISWNLDV
jgi:hypothetical protein